MSETLKTTAEERIAIRARAEQMLAALPAGRQYQEFACTMGLIIDLVDDIEVCVARIEAADRRELDRALVGQEGPNP